MCDKIKSTSDTCYLRYHLKQQETMHVFVSTLEMFKSKSYHKSSKYSKRLPS